MKARHVCPWGLMTGLLLMSPDLRAGTIAGHVRDQNWFAQYQNNPNGLGYYEYAVNANGYALSSAGGADDTDVFGVFQMPNLPAGRYTVASWDVWWRSTYAFDVSVGNTGATPEVDLRLRATMWGYPAFWEDTGYYEFGQTFAATGPISMIYLRSASETAYTLTIHENSPGGRQIGEARTLYGGDQRLIYGYGQMPTAAGRLYYARVRTSSTQVKGNVLQMDPRPDFSDPMPEGCLYLGQGGFVAPYPDRDLGLVIMCDDDGLLTNLFVRPGNTSLSGISVGQSFIARGVNLISVAVWIGEAAPIYNIRIYQGGPGGAQVGTTKKGRIARSADPEMIVTWLPGECPLVPSQTYYLEVTREDGNPINLAMADNHNAYAYGQAYRARVPLTITDLAGTIMEELQPGSATRATIKITSGPVIQDAERRTDNLVIRWATDVASDSAAELAPATPPYVIFQTDPVQATNHAITVSQLTPNTLYHFRVQSSAAGFRPAVSRDMVICTQPDHPNLLKNPGFEDGTGASPRKPIRNWSAHGSLDTAASDGSWFWALKPRSGKWLMEGAVNGGSSDGGIFQRVEVLPGKRYAFSAWVTTWPRENDTWKYDVWDRKDRLVYMRLGIDPTGGANPSSAAIQWTPRMYSHRHFSQLCKIAAAQSNFMTVFIRMQGDGVQWHLFGVDDCVLAEADLPAVSPRFIQAQRAQDGSVQLGLLGQVGQTNEVHTSANLRFWFPWTNVVNRSGYLYLSDSNRYDARRYYRAVVVP